MKKYLIICAALAIVSCSKKESTSVKADKGMLQETAVEAVKSPSANISEGLALIEGADCMSCHKTNERVIGPSYQEIADKYSPADLNILAAKIMEGGVGNWGQVPMPAHPGMSKENAKKMVAYIMTLKK